MLSVILHLPIANHQSETHHGCSGIVNKIRLRMNAPQRHRSKETRHQKKTICRIFVARPLCQPLPMSTKQMKVRCFSAEDTTSAQNCRRPFFGRKMNCILSGYVVETQEVEVVTGVEYVATSRDVTGHWLCEGSGYSCRHATSFRSIMAGLFR